MDYNLALQLKDAGFPQKGKGEWRDEYAFRSKQTEETAYIPTLEELIEALGEDFGSLHPAPYGGWEVDMSEDRFEKERQKYPEYCDIACDGHESGETPTEAVARLWLALNDGRNGD